MEAQLLTEVARGIGGAATGDPGVRAQRVAQVAAQHAVEVDSAARFPHEAAAALKAERLLGIDRKSTRLNSSHTVISYAVFCLKKKKKKKKDKTSITKNKN